MRDMEIQQVPELEPTKAKIAEQLSPMHGEDCRNSFELDDH